MFDDMELLRTDDSDCTHHFAHLCCFVSVIKKRQTDVSGVFLSGSKDLLASVSGMALPLRRQ